MAARASLSDLVPFKFAAAALGRLQAPLCGVVISQCPPLAVIDPTHFLRPKTPTFLQRSRAGCWVPLDSTHSAPMTSHVRPAQPPRLPRSICATGTELWQRCGRQTPPRSAAQCLRLPQPPRWRDNRWRCGLGGIGIGSGLNQRFRRGQVLADAVTRLAYL